MLLTASVGLVVGLLVLTDDQRRVAAKRIRDALRLAEIGIVDAADYMNLDPAEFERGLSGTRKLDIFRLEKLPPAFWQHYHYLGALAHGLPENIRKAVKMRLHEAVDTERKTG